MKGYKKEARKKASKLTKALEIMLLKTLIGMLPLE